MRWTWLIGNGIQIISLYLDLNLIAWLLHKSSWNSRLFRQFFFHVWCIISCLKFYRNSFKFFRNCTLTSHETAASSPLNLMAKDEEREGHTRALLSFFVRNNIEMDARANSPVSQQLFSVRSLDENEEKNEGKNTIIFLSPKSIFS